jgi:uncharacterized SAM-binding protein YcdF (DUF218 family)
MRATPKIVRFLLAASGVIIAGLALGFLFFATIATRELPKTHHRADGIVVLTGGVQRIAEAGRLLEQGMAKRLLISGINKVTTRRDIQRLLKIRDKAFTCCVDLGYTARNTRGNADETRAWVETHRFESVIVVTASYHMPRSLAELAGSMPNVRLIAHPVVPAKFKNSPWWLDISKIGILAREYIKFLPSAARYGVTRLTHGRRTGRNDNAQHADRDS